MGSKEIIRPHEYGVTIPIDTTGKVSVADKLLSWRKQSLHELLDLLKLYIDIREHTYWHIHIHTTPNKFTFGLCNS